MGRCSWKIGVFVARGVPTAWAVPEKRVFLTNGRSRVGGVRSGKACLIGAEVRSRRAGECYLGGRGEEACLVTRGVRGPEACAGISAFVGFGRAVVVGCSLLAGVLEVIRGLTEQGVP